MTKMVSQVLSTGLLSIMKLSSFLCYMLQLWLLDMLVKCPPFVITKSFVGIYLKLLQSLSNIHFISVQFHLLFDGLQYVIINNNEALGQSRLSRCLPRKPEDLSLPHMQMNSGRMDSGKSSSTSAYTHVPQHVCNLSHMKLIYFQ